MNPGRRVGRLGHGREAQQSCEDDQAHHAAGRIHEASAGFARKKGVTHEL
jgi:hypothetical protein